MQPTRIITTNQIFGITKTNRLKRIAGITAGIMAALFAASCSSDAFFGFDDDLTNNYYDNNGIVGYNVYDRNYIDIDLSKKFEGRDKEKAKYDEAIRRIATNCSFYKGKIKLSHITASDLNINEDFFELFKELLESLYPVPPIVSKSIYPVNKDWNPESSKPSGYYLVYAACLAAMNSDIERKCFNQYWYALGDLALTDIEWNGGIKQHAISEIGTNFESDSTIERVLFIM